MADLSLRLTAVLELVPRCDTAADIGSDHGKLAAALLRNGLCRRVIATDVSEGALGRLRDTVVAADLEKSVDCRLGDGFAPLRRGEAQAAVIAGMGGRLIADIIGRSLPAAREMTLILAPMQNTDALRAYLRGHDFRIERESIVYEGRHFYAVMRAAAGRETSGVPPRIYDEVGPRLFENRDPLALRRLQRQMYSLRSKRIGHEEQPGLEERIGLLQSILDDWGESL